MAKHVYNFIFHHENILKHVELFMLLETDTKHKFNIMRNLGFSSIGLKKKKLPSGSRYV